jgi:hypothetical protein
VNQNLGHIALIDRRESAISICSPSYGNLFGMLLYFLASGLIRASVLARGVPQVFKLPTTSRCASLRKCRLKSFSRRLLYLRTTRWSFRSDLTCKISRAHSAAIHGCYRVCHFETDCPRSFVRFPTASSLHLESLRWNHPATYCSASSTFGGPE